MKVKVESEKVVLKLNIQKTKIMASGPITSWQIHGETVETVSDFIFWGSTITADGDCSHDIKRRLLLGRKVMTNRDSIFKNRDITLSTKVNLSSVRSLSHVRLYVIPWITVRQASLSITNTRSSLRHTSIKSVMPSSHLIFCRPFSSCPQSLPETGTNGMWYRKGGRKFQTKDVRQTPSRVMIPMRHKRNLIKGKTDPTWSYLLSGSTKTMTYSSEPQFSSLQSLSCVWLFATPWTAAHQASLSINNSQFVQTRVH